MIHQSRNWEDLQDGDHLEEEEDHQEKEEDHREEEEDCQEDHREERPLPQEEPGNQPHQTKMLGHMAPHQLPSMETEPWPITSSMSSNSISISTGWYPHTNLTLPRPPLP